jgi:geranylgeranyl pyrophosphate synthase
MLQQMLPANPAAMDVLLKGMRELFVGQSWKLKWKFHVSCPSVQEYMAMIDGKTDAMFILLVRLMHSFSQHSVSLPELDRLATLLGRFYQVRDDYLNLQSDDYSEQKGFCEDLDEGKFSYPIVSCFNSDPIA